MDTLFDKFGGTRAMAARLSEPPSTIQSWKRAGRIPAAKQPLILERAVLLGIDITPAEVVFPNGAPQLSDPAEQVIA